MEALCIEFSSVKLYLRFLILLLWHLIHKTYTELLTAWEKLLLVIKSNLLLNLRIIAFSIQEILLVHFHILPFILHLETLRSMLFHYK